MDKNLINSGLVFILLGIPALFIIGQLTNETFVVGFGFTLIIIGSGIILIIIGLLTKKKEAEKKKEFNEEAVERKWKNRAFHFGENEKEKQNMEGE